MKFGESRVHPFIQLESRFDSAASMIRPGAAVYEVEGDLLLHVMPGLKLDLPSPNFAVALNGNADYVRYLGVLHEGTTKASHLRGDADLTLGINRAGTFSVELGNHFARSDAASTTATLKVGALMLHNEARIKAAYRPEGGALQVEPEYRLRTEFFSNAFDGVTVPGCSDGDPTCASKSVNSLDALDHRFGLSARWRFLPKTALTLDSGFNMRRYLSSSGTPLDALQGTLGLTGLLSMHLSVNLRAGWAHEFKAAAFSSMIAQAELTYLLSQTGQIRAGYLRTFDPDADPTAVSRRDDRGYLEARLLLGGSLSLRGYTAVSFLGFRGGTAPRDDIRISADIGADYELRQWVNFGAGYSLNFMSSSRTTYLGLKDFTRNEVYTRVQLVY